MKLRTNLSPNELEKISKGIKLAADKKRARPYLPENNAEAELMRKADGMFDSLLNSLQEDVADILLEKDK